MKIPAAIAKDSRKKISAPRRLALGLQLVCLFFAAAAFGQTPGGIVNSKHNLSVSGPGDLRAATESDICIFCHAPHHATTDGPLWNHQMSIQSYTPYFSKTLKATVGQPTGSSKLCLSCHDGTVALGMVYNRSTAIAMQSSVSAIPVGRSTRFGTDLSAHHPVSFTYDPGLATARGELRDPTTLPPEVRLEGGELQCTSCHDAHNNQYGSFLVKNNTASALCLDCHAPNHWSTSAHATSTATWTGSGQNPWPHTSETTVAANACENCHQPHAAQTAKSLLNFTPAEQNCYSCHSGTVAAAAKNIANEFGKMSIHPITVNSAVHDPTEDIKNPPRHVVCVDCHNPHATSPSVAAPVAPAASSVLAGVRGVNTAGTEVRELVNEYELCFRCHGDSTGRGTSLVQRQVTQTNTRQEFDLSNVSFHPVEGVGENTSMPSLTILPWTANSVIYCTDCHNNDQGPNAHGTGPNGPHGSAYAPILERQLVLTDLMPYSADNFKLCYKCHSETSIMGDESFAHKKHVGDDVKAACTTCHDSHASTQPHLINFNTAYVGGALQYNSTETSHHGSCALTCHDGSGHSMTHTITNSVY